MTESFMDKFKRGASENAQTARSAKEKVDEAARKSKEGWNQFKMGYQNNSTQSSVELPTTSVPISIGAGKKYKRKTRKRRKSMKGGKRKSRKMPPPRRKKRKGGHHELLLLGAAGLANIYSKKNKRKSKRKRKSKKRKTKRRRRRR